MISAELPVGVDGGAAITSVGRWGTDKALLTWAGARGIDAVFHAKDRDFPQSCSRNYFPIFRGGGPG